MGYSIVRGTSDCPVGVKIVKAVLTPFARNTRTFTFVPNDETVLISAPLVRNVCLEIVIRWVLLVSRSSAAMITNSIDGVLIAVVLGRVFKKRCASEMRD